MSSTRTLGREREVSEIIILLRAAEVGRLMMSELNGPMKWIHHDQYIEKPRREIQTQKVALRKNLRGEVAKFCRNNFVGVQPIKLANIYEPLYARGSTWRLPLVEFAERLGQPRDGVLKGSPLHSTVVLSPWGLQTEFPEMHLVKDMSVAFNSLLEVEEQLSEYKNMSWDKVKDGKTRSNIADLIRRVAYYRRMCVLSCFNLAEAYINGIAWQYVQTNDISSLSETKKKLLTEGGASILDKLVKVPLIVASNLVSPLEKEKEPLVTFRDTIKPFRDSIVHASPFAAPERFGGYEKLTKIYELSTDTVKQTVDMTIEIIGLIHRFVGGKKDLPQWIPERGKMGVFLIDE